MHRKKGVFWGLFAGVLWGLDGVLMGIYFLKVSIINSGSVLIIAIIGACIHDGLGAVWIFLKNLISGKGQIYRRVLSSKSSISLIVGAALGGPVGMTGNLLGIQLAGVSYSSAITACYPVLGAFLGMVFLKENVKFSGFLGIALAVVGAIMVGYNPPSDGNFPYFYLGICFAILAVIGWALEGVVSKYSMNSIDSDIVVGIQKIYSCITYSVIILFLSASGYKLVISSFINLYFTIVCLASLVGALSYLCWYRSMNILGVSISMSLNITYALWSVVFSSILIGLNLTSMLISGVLVITIGTILTIRGTKDKIAQL